jgi:hypothetical protein
MAKIVTRPSARVKPTVASMPPHLVGPLGQDRAVLALGPNRLRLPLRSQQAVLAHQPQHAPHRGVHLAHPQPRPHLAVAFAVEGRLLDGAPDLGQEVLIAEASLRDRDGRAASGRGAADAARRRSTAASPKPSAPEPARMAALWRPTGHGSSLRPPPQKRLLVLHAPDALTQELVLHGQFGDDRLHTPALLVHQVLLPDLESLSASRQGGVAHSVRAATVTPFLRLVDSKSVPRSGSKTTLALRLAEQAPLAPRPVSASRGGRPQGRWSGPGNRMIGVGLVSPFMLQSVSNQIVRQVIPTVEVRHAGQVNGVLPRWPELSVIRP